MEVALAPEVIGSIGPFEITNTIAATILVDAVLVLLIIILNKNLNRVPGKLQSAFEILVSYFHQTTEEIAGRFTSSIFPWFGSFFLFIFTANIMGLMPGFGTIGFFEHHHGTEVFVPLFRAPTSDFNTTLALACISLVATHVIAVHYNGFIGYLKKFFSLNPILLFVGLLELVSEITKVISLSFRLFGNIYAGEVVLHTISGLAAVLAPIPFLLLESIVAFVQALVFAMLTMVFMTILANPHEEGAH